jgi:DNA polymerase III epsilon subunit-like protein
MKYLFFDKETTGLPKNYKAPVTDVDNWPRLVQLAWMAYDEANGVGEIEKSWARCNVIIKPDGFTIPEDVAKLHGVTQARAMEEGKNLRMVLGDFASMIQWADKLVAHNIAFDEKIVGAEFIRQEMPNHVNDKPHFCTMLASVDVCKIQSPYGFKWPKLKELHTTLFGCEFADQHNAAADIEATAKCFFEMKRRKIIGI